MIRFLFILSILSASLFARLNPFEPADRQFVGDVGSRTLININNKDDGNRTLKKVESNVSIKEKAIDTTVAKEAPKKVVEDVLTKISNNNNNSNTTHVESKRIQKSETIKSNKKVLKSKKYLKKKISKSKVAFSKTQKKKLPKAVRYNILPLLTIDLLGKSLTIKTTNNYKLIRHYEEKNENKFVFDFQAAIGVPTANENLLTKYYKSYIVGNHPEDGYFRVVIITSDRVSNYKVMIKNNTVTITHK